MKRCLNLIIGDSENGVKKEMNEQNNKIKVLIMTTIPAPYRIDYFNELGKYCDLIVCFERLTETGRHKDWYLHDFENFKGVFLRRSALFSLEITYLIKQYKCDLYIAFEYCTMAAAVFMTMLKLNKRPYLINCDGALVIKNSLKTPIKRFFISNAAACLANGEHAKRYFLHFGAKKQNIYLHQFSSIYSSEILDSPIPMASKKLFRNEINIRCEKLAIAVGQFIHRKGFDVLIRAWSKVDLDYKLIIVGGGEKEQEYRDMIKSLNIKNIELIGFKKKGELQKYYFASDLFILPTREDIWGLVINEAMACGLPVITTDRCIAGLELIKDNENGFVVPVDDADVLAQRVNQVLSDDILSMKLAANNLNKIKPYTIDNMARIHSELFGKIKVKVG